MFLAEAEGLFAPKWKSDRARNTTAQATDLTSVGGQLYVYVYARVVTRLYRALHLRVALFFVFACTKITRPYVKDGV